MGNLEYEEIIMVGKLFDFSGKTPSTSERAMYEMPFSKRMCEVDNINKKVIRSWPFEEFTEYIKNNNEKDEE